MSSGGRGRKFSPRPAQPVDRRRKRGSVAAVPSSHPDQLFHFQINLSASLLLEYCLLRDFLCGSFAGILAFLSQQPRAAMIASRLLYIIIDNLPLNLYTPNGKATLFRRLGARGFASLAAGTATRKQDIEIARHRIKLIKEI